MKHHKEMKMRSINITQDIEQVLRELVLAVPEVFLSYDLELIELQVDDESRPTVWEIVVVESEDTELLIGEVLLMEDFTAYIDIFED
jgi:hypothetical protein